MAVVSLEVERAIEDILAQVRIELKRLYAAGDIGTVTVHCGAEQMRVKATPERIREPVRVKAE
jgi:hypothetical protein